MSTPWWFSGEPEEQAEPRRTTDFAALAAGAQQLVEFARAALLAPHAGHVDPAEHPECLLCRASAAFGDRAASGRPTAPARAITWIPIEREP